MHRIQRVGQAKNLHLHRHCFQDHSSCHSFIKRVTSYLDFMSPVKPPTPLTVPPAWEAIAAAGFLARSEEHTSELQSLMRISYAVFCLKKKNNKHISQTYTPAPNISTTLHLYSN